MSFLFLCTGSTENNSVDLPAAIVVPIIIVTIIGVIVLAAMSIIVLIVDQNRRSTPIIVKFSVKHESGSLARALKVFEVREIATQCIHTCLHLHTRRITTSTFLVLILIYTMLILTVLQDQDIKIITCIVSAQRNIKKL